MLVVPQAADSEAIAKAREALRQKLKELETLPPPADATVAPRTSAPVLAVMPSLDADTYARLRAAVRQKIEELIQLELAATQPGRAQDRKLLAPAGAKGKTGPSVSEATPGGIPSAVASAPVQPGRAQDKSLLAPAGAKGTTGPNVSEAAPGTLPALSATTADKKAVAALEERKAWETRRKQEQARRKSDKKAGGLAFEPFRSPPSPLSAEKQQRLADLLAKYAAESITPGEYHHQRADILAAP
jgi:hypothetical protein